MGERRTLVKNGKEAFVEKPDGKFQWTYSIGSMLKEALTLSSMLVERSNCSFMIGYTFLNQAFVKSSAYHSSSVTIYLDFLIKISSIRTVISLWFWLLKDLSKLKDRWPRIRPVILFAKASVSLGRVGEPFRI